MQFFTYLDRYYVKHHSLPTLEQAGLRCFKTHIFANIKEDATQAILNLVAEERQGGIIDKSLVKSIVELYESMGMGTLDAYTQDLEAPMLQATREYYIQKRQVWINDSTPQYLIKAEQALKDDPGDNQARIQLVAVLAALGDQKAQDAMVLELADRTGMYPGLTGPLARLYLRRGDIDKLEALIGDKERFLPLMTLRTASMQEFLSWIKWTLSGGPVAAMSSMSRLSLGPVTGGMWYS